MILGADNAFGNRKTVTIFDRMTKEFSSGVKMNYNRENAACTIFKSPNHGNRPVVFVGGGKEQKLLRFWTIPNQMPHGKKVNLKLFVFKKEYICIHRLRTPKEGINQRYLKN